VNIEQPLEGEQLHREAASIFEGLNDQRGLAETYDLLGMASFRSSDLPGAAEHYHRAIAIFRQIGERSGLISSLSMLTGCAWNYSTNTAVPAALSLLECTSAGKEALQLARDISWRAGEAYALICLSWCLGAYGDYGHALHNAQTSLGIAEGIEHRQWMTAAHWSLGAIYLDLLVLPKAQHHLESALALAREISSVIWINHVSALLVSTYLAQGDDQSAEAVLDALPSDMGSDAWTATMLVCASRTRPCSERFQSNVAYCNATDDCYSPRCQRP
jgi:tetratricopeptide (TPR) repeat protein